MVRPLKAINLLHRLMGEQLTKPNDALQDHSAVAIDSCPRLTEAVKVHSSCKPMQRRQ